MTAPTPKTPLFPLDLVVLPGEDVPLHIFEPRYRKMIARCIRDRGPFVVVRLHEGVMTSVGCTLQVRKVTRRYPDGRFDIVAAGLERVQVRDISEHEDGFLHGDVIDAPDDVEGPDHELEDRAAQIYLRYATLAGDVSREPPARGPRWSYRLATRMRLTSDARQELLETRSENGRIERVILFAQILIPLLERKEKGQIVVRGNGKLHGAEQGGGS